jgi:hypothetical protein
MITLEGRRELGVLKRVNCHLGQKHRRLELDKGLAYMRYADN